MRAPDFTAPPKAFFNERSARRFFRHAAFSQDEGGVFFVEVSNSLGFLAAKDSPSHLLKGVLLQYPLTHALRKGQHGRRFRRIHRLSVLVDFR